MKTLAFVILSAFLLVGCASNGVNQNQSTNNAPSIPSGLPLATDSEPLNPKHGDTIWGPLKVGMSVSEAMSSLPNTKFDDQWSSGGMVGVMAEAGIIATNKIKVTAEVQGPFNSPSTLYILFDKNMRLDGVIIGTSRKNWPAAVTENFGTIGYYLPEFKDAAKQIIKFAIPELGKREGPPRFGKEQMDSIGTVGVAKGVGANRAVGIGFSAGSMSPASISQNYSREGYRSLVSIRAIYLGTYGVYSASFVFMSIQAKSAGDDDIPDVE